MILDIQKIPEMSEPRLKQKKQNRRPQPRKHTKGPPYYLGVFNLHYFFGTMRLFFRKFFYYTKETPFNCFNNLQQDRCQKIPKRPPFYIFRHCDTVQKFHFFIFFRKVLMSPEAPLTFFTFCNKLEFQKAQRVPACTILKTFRFFQLDIAPTLAVPCWFQVYKKEGAQ